jgi:hypothetical protein
MLTLTDLACCRTAGCRMEDVLPSMNPNVLGRLKYEAESLDDDDRGGVVDSEPEEEEDD